MISFIKGFDIERNPAATDRPFSPMENPQEEAGALDPQTRVFGSMDDMDTDVVDDDIAYLDEENGISLRIGDMVWGKVKSHPWWPGHIFNASFASTSVRRMRREGFVLVAFFGDSSYGWFDPAELIPFDLHFNEKSRQTTSRSFVKAVEEAVDEASRRGSLAVACRCRNLNNFRPTAVGGYFFVDILGYEPGGIYSSRQIEKSRDSLVPVEVISFVRQLAVDACGGYENHVEWIQMMAKLLAYRKAVFEEYDETYAQAFGVEPVRSSPNSMVAFDQTDRFAPRGAPLSGPLVVAENLGGRRSAAKQAPNKAINPGKKNKYVLKRRDDLPAASSSAAAATAIAATSYSLPDLHSASQPLYHGFFESLPNSANPLPSATDANYVLWKNEKLPPPPDAATLFQPTTAEAFLPPVYPQISESVEVKIDAGSSQSMAPNEYQMPPIQARHDGIAVAKNEKPPKRAREDLSEGGEAEKKNKKKKDGLGADQFPSSLVADQGMLEEDGSDMELPPGLELSSLQLPHLVSDLSSIALDPFYAIERDAPAIVRHVFLRFRSLVYQKSLIFPASMEPSDIGASVGREAREHKESSSSSSKLQKPDPRLAVRKRDPSDRQEELWVKKYEKMNQLKQLASKKKKAAAINPKSSEFQQPKDGTATASATIIEASRKHERPPSPKLPSPTFLIMKFPPRSTLPSVSNLKARFARFGPLDLLGTRVYWKNYTCRVLFKYKSDAQSAFNFVQSNDLFGQVKVNYYLKDHEIPGSEQPIDPQNKPSDMDSLQYRHGSANIQKAQQSQTQLKSILKKPVGDESGSNSAAASINITRDSPRVKFVLNGDDDRSSEPPPPPPKPVTSSNNGGGQSPLVPSVDQISRQPPKSTLFFPPPLLQPLQPPSRSQPSSQQTLPPPPQMMLPPRPPPPQPRGGVQFHPSRAFLPPLAPPIDPRDKMADDISGPMLSLLLKCNDVVSNVKSSLGYNPYHSL